MTVHRSIAFASLFAALTLLVGCNDSNFAGGGKTATTSQASEPDDEESTELGTTGESTPIKRKPKKTVEDSADEDEGSVKPSDNPTVVTRGSFSAWAEPPAPALGQNYHIIIEVKLPSSANISSYSLADLQGELTGTDSYHQSISTNPTMWNSYDPPISIPLPEFVISGRVARLKVNVPGALVPLTRDTVTMRSRLLNEQQTLRIQFQ